MCIKLIGLVLFSAVWKQPSQDSNIYGAVTEWSCWFCGWRSVALVDAPEQHGRSPADRGSSSGFKGVYVRVCGVGILWLGEGIVAQCL